MAYLPNNEWLPQAQKLAVGQSMRVRHNNEATAAMSIANKGDRWVAYCQRCHAGGSVTKSHVVLSQVADQARFMPWPEDAKALSSWDTWVQEPLYSFCLTKGIDLSVMCPDVPIWYSQKQRRLLFGTKKGWLGRATAGQQPKWTGYGYPAPAYGAQATEPVRSTVIVTEDLLSAMKVRWAIKGTYNATAQALLGTALRDTHAADLLAANVDTLVLFLDGDNAGRDGARLVRRRAAGLGLRVLTAECPEGFDPKDLPKQTIIDILGGVLGDSNSASVTESG